MKQEPTFESPKEGESETSPEVTIEEGVIDDPKGRWWEKLPAGLEPKDVETWAEWVAEEEEEGEREEVEEKKKQKKGMWVLHWCKKGKRKDIPGLDWPGR